jgi:hypothetical protein
VEHEKVGGGAVSRENVVRESDGSRILHQIRCDGVGCDDVIVPNPNISFSGWIRRGTDRGLGTDKLEWDYCPRCAT